MREVVSAVGDLDNVLYEIGNEHFEDSMDWQYHMANYLREYEQCRFGYHHPIGITSGGGGPDEVTNEQLCQSCRLGFPTARSCNSVQGCAPLRSTCPK